MSYSSTVLADSPAGYYRLDETGVDSSGNGRPLSAFGSLTYGSAALVPGDTCTTFPGVSGTQNQLVSASASWMNVTTALTVEAWCSPTAIGSTQEILLRDDGGGSGQGSWRLRVNAGGIVEFLLWTGASPGTLTTVAGSTVLTAGSVYHVVATFDGITVNIYVNGALDKSQSVSGTPYNSGQGIHIGQLGSGGAYAEPFNGRIGECAIYSSALSGTRVSAHYSAASGGTYTATVQADAPLAYWKLNAAPATSFADSSGNSRPLTVSGGYASTAGATGDGDNAVKLNGNAGGYIGSPTWPRLSTFTVECWAKWTSASQMAFVCFDNASISPTDQARVFQLRTTSAGKVQFECYSTGGAVLDVNSTAALNDGNWHHVAVVVSGSAVVLYIDGASNATGTISGTLNSGSSTSGNWLTLAANSAAGPANNIQLTGSLDEIAYYPAALSAARVSAHYSAGIGSTTDTGATSMSAQAGMGITPTVTHPETAALSAQAGMHVQGAAGAVVTFSARTSLSVTGTVTRSAPVGMSARSSLSVSGTHPVPGASPLAARASLSISGTSGPPSGTQMSAHAGLSLTATIVASAHLSTALHLGDALRAVAIGPQHYAALLTGLRFTAAPGALGDAVVTVESDLGFGSALSGQGLAVALPASAGLTLGCTVAAYAAADAGPITSALTLADQVSYTPDLPSATQQLLLGFTAHAAPTLVPPEPGAFTWRAMQSLVLTVPEPVVADGHPYTPLYWGQASSTAMLTEGGGHIRAVPAPVYVAPRLPVPPVPGAGSFSRWDASTLPDPAAFGGWYWLGDPSWSDGTAYIAGNCRQWDPSAGSSRGTPPWRSAYPFKPSVVSADHWLWGGGTVHHGRAVNFNSQFIEHMWADLPHGQPFTVALAAMIPTYPVEGYVHHLLDAGWDPYAVGMPQLSAADCYTPRPVNDSPGYHVALTASPARAEMATSGNARLRTTNHGAAMPRMYFGVFDAGSSKLGVYGPDGRYASRGSLPSVSAGRLIIGRQQGVLDQARASHLLLFEIRMWGAALSDADLAAQYANLATLYQFERYRREA